MSDRMTGKTTSIMETAIELLAELPDDSCVYITSPYTKQLYDLEVDFRNEGLVGVSFVALTRVFRGALRGVKGVLLIDDLDAMTGEERELIFYEQIRLARHCGIEL